MAAFKVAALDRFPDFRVCYPGGNAMNQSVAFRQSGWDASFVGALGNDEAGALLLSALKAYGVDCSKAHRMAGKTAGNTLLVDTEGERFEADGAELGRQTADHPGALPWPAPMAEHAEAAFRASSSELT